MFWNFEKEFTLYTPSELVTKMCKYEMDVPSIVEVTERTWICGCQPNEPQASLTTTNICNHVYVVLFLYCYFMYAVIHCLYSVGNKITTTTTTVHRQMDRRMDRRTDGRTTWNQYTPLSTSLKQGVWQCYSTDQSIVDGDLTWNT